MISKTTQEMYFMLRTVPRWLLMIARTTGESEKDLHEFEDRLMAIESERKKYERSELKRSVYDFKSELLDTYPELRPAKSDTQITEEMIQRAREADITQLIEHRGMWAVCPFHDDTKPSMFLKNNFAHCFSCGTTADTIALVQQRYNVDFKTAVKVLNNI
jgi:hypothetical protein